MNERVKSEFIWAGVSLIIVIVLIIIIKASTGVTNVSVGTTLKTPVTINDHRQGPTPAKVTLIEYGDFECPVCYTYYPMVTQLQKDFPNNLAVIFREFPLTTIHHNAQIAAQAAEAAAKQGKFWDMHDVLYNTQNQWSGKQEPTNYFAILAHSIGLHVNQFKIDIKSQAIKNRVAKDVNSANANGLNATPTFFLNGKEIKNPKTYNDFKILIQHAMGSSNSSSTPHYESIGTTTATAQ